MTSYPIREVQGLLFSGYLEHRHATYLTLRIGAGAAPHRWLRELVGRLCFGGDADRPDKVNVAFAETGLERFGASPNALASFAPAFGEGMFASRRSRILGDDEESEPARWKWGGSKRDVDALLLVFSKNADAHAQHVARERQEAEANGLAIGTVLSPAPLPASRDEMNEPFGFADGLSQPYFEGAPGAEELSDEAHRLHHVPVGEFLLGYKNVYGEETSVPWLADAAAEPRFGRNGTYLVIRELQQDVAGFWKYFHEQAGGGGRAEAERLAAKAVGRWRNGAPVVTHPDAPPKAFSRDDANDFSFRADDPHGERCPFGAHVRRANPRDSFPGERPEVLAQVNAHRLLRRGRPYGDAIADPTTFVDDQRERGLFFACLNANIERQFEFVQQSWLDNPNFLGLHDERDPVIGSSPDARFTIPGTPVRRRLAGIPRFVTVRGGGYFFVPGRRGLAELALLGA
jgi:Dyp-type peroxidase family